MKTMNRIRWNTGRCYTVNGQRIAAAEIDNGVYFYDADRMVSGFIAHCPLDIAIIMTNYDSQNYTYRPPSLDLNNPECTANPDQVIASFRALENSIRDLAVGANRAY